MFEHQTLANDERGMRENQLSCYFYFYLFHIKNLINQSINQLLAFSHSPATFANATPKFTTKRLKFSLLGNGSECYFGRQEKESKLTF